MKTLSVSKDIVPIGEFKAGMAKWFKELRSSGSPLIITQNGKPAGVLLSPREYDALVYRKEFMDAVERGLEDEVHGRTYTGQEVRDLLRQRRES
ncbi:MAG: type II toxin-antitoxin system Phd/YefM family antitoxin [Deltaproteobacteria bacterium]|jgi:antitoxin YefM|nr:type II toxin-antitoxin system Phd/YefM family antitoxin [Deltaproteobacteria bacterium]